MKTSKKFLGVTNLMAVTSLLLTGCGKGEAPDYSKYANTSVMDISGWVSPCPNVVGHDNPNNITDEGYKTLKECGFTAIYALYEHVNPQATEDAAKLATKYGIKYYVRDTGNIAGDPIEDELEQGDIRNRAYVQRYCNEPGFAGHLAVDEPGANAFDRLGHLKSFYEEEFPGKEFYVNLFPTYALTSQIQTEKYEDYISQYIDKVNPEFLSYDHYALEEDSYGNMKITSDVLLNHYIVAKLCKAAGIPYGNFTQTLSFGGSSRWIKCEEELRWQIMVDLAYGCSRVQYFCYQSPIEWESDIRLGKKQEALITVNNEKTDTYYYAQNINKTIAKMDEAYLNFAWNDTLLVDGTETVKVNKSFDMMREGNNLVTSLPGLKSVTTTLDALIGQFDSKVDNHKGYMVTNFAEPSNDKNTNSVKLTFENARGAVIYDHDEVKTVDIKGGVLEYDIGPGCGIFIIPF